jgi:hypothetical protein
MHASDRSRSAAVYWGSAGSALRSQVSSGEDRLSRCARGEGLIASNARFGPIPLPLGAGLCQRGIRGQALGVLLWPVIGHWGWWLRTVGGWGSAGSALRSQVSSGEDRLSRCARGEGLIASNARFGPIPLRCGFLGLRGFGPALAVGSAGFRRLLVGGRGPGLGQWRRVE